jgi:hypothetical protein
MRPRDSSSVPPPLEVEVQLQHSTVENDSKSESGAQLPLAIDNLESHILIRGPRMEAEDDALIGVSLLNVILWSDGFVDQIWVEDVELVALHNLRWRVVMVIVRLVVLVPLEARLDAVEESRLTRLVLVLPVIVAIEPHLPVPRVAAIESSFILPHALGKLGCEEVILSRAANTAASDMFGFRDSLWESEQVIAATP